MKYETRFGTALLFGLAAAFAFTPAWADTLRCGNVLVETGDVAAYVAEKCGEPTSKETITEPVRAFHPDGTTYDTGITLTREIWRYDWGSRKFPAVLTFEEGVLKKMEFEK